METVRFTDISVKMIPDAEPELSYLGSFSNERSGFYSLRHHGSAGSCRYFNAANVSNWDEAKQNYERAKTYGETWECYGVKAVAKFYLNGVHQVISSGGVWGIESDSGSDYFTELATEQLDELSGLLDELGILSPAQDLIATAIERFRLTI